jgi:hypothetical protein
MGLRGIDLHAVDLSNLPLARVHCGLSLNEWSSASADQRDMAAAHLESANLRFAHLKEANLGATHLECAVCLGARLERAELPEASLEKADRAGEHLEGANLRDARLDSKTVLNGSTLDRQTRVGDIQWSGVGAVNLTPINWDNVPTLGEEQYAGPRSPATEHKGAVRAYRQFAAQLRAQGMKEVADRFDLRAQIRQRGVLLRRGRILAYLGSRLLALLAGYGSRPGRSILWYLAICAGFAARFLQFGVVDGHPFNLTEALVFSLTSFHGRGFFPGGLKLDDPVTVIAADEAIIGLLIEIGFIVTFTQCCFGSK